MRLNLLWVSVSPSAKKLCLCLTGCLQTSLIREQRTPRGTSAFFALAFSSTEWEEVFLVVEQFFFPVLGPRCCALAFSSCG